MFCSLTKGVLPMDGKIPLAILLELVQLILISDQLGYDWTHN
jgi:hypothetical protein